MFAKYNIPFDDSSWPIKPPRQTARVEKQIRMRVRIVCHYCQAHYSSSRECPTCHHRRCEKCTRLPEKKKEKEKESHSKPTTEGRTEGLTRPSSPRALLFRELTANVDPLSVGEAEDEPDRPESILDLIPGRPKRRQDISPTSSPRIGGQRLFRKDPLGRILQACCKCQGSFTRNSSECPLCTHIRCPECAPLPPNPEEWATGYDEDMVQAEPERVTRQIKRPRVRVRWTCHECRQLFIQGEHRCANCSHYRCSNCERNPPRRTKQRPRYDVFSALEKSFEAVASSSNQPKFPEDSTVAEESVKDEEPASVEESVNIEQSANVEESAKPKPGESAIPEQPSIPKKSTITKDAGVAEDRDATSCSKEETDSEKAAASS